MRARWWSWYFSQNRCGNLALGRRVAGTSELVRGWKAGESLPAIRRTEKTCRASLLVGMVTVSKWMPKIATLTFRRKDFRAHDEPEGWGVGSGRGEGKGEGSCTSRMGLGRSFRWSRSIGTRPLPTFSTSFFEKLKPGRSERPSPLRLMLRSLLRTLGMARDEPRGVGEVHFGPRSGRAG